MSTKSTHNSNNQIVDQLESALGAGSIQRSHSLAGISWMKVGGPADYFFIAKSASELELAVSTAIKIGISYKVLGGGSNILIRDGGIRGLVIHNRSNDLQIDPNNSHLIKVDSGVFVNRLVGFAIQNSLAGIEEFLGIPGTVGGAIYNNSHHLDHLIGDYIESVEVLDSEGGVKVYSQSDMKFAYDYSILHDTKEIVLSVVFKLNPGDKKDLDQVSKAALDRRRNTQPLEIPSSGCMFQNIGIDQAEKYNTPNHSTSAGFLIDKAGLKGLKIGGAEVSDVHANFIVNTGDATAKDVIELSQAVEEKVKNKFGVTLKKEVFFIGED